MPPKSQRQKLQIIRIPNDYIPVIHPPNYPPMPRLYMELLENKAKIKPHLRNKEYEPKNTAVSIPNLSVASSSIDPEIIKPEDSVSDHSKSVGDNERKNFEIKSKQPSKKKPLQILDLENSGNEPISLTGGDTPSVTRKSEVPASSEEHHRSEADSILQKYKERKSVAEKDYKSEESLDSSSQARKSSKTEEGNYRNYNEDNNKNIEDDGKPFDTDQKFRGFRTSDESQRTHDFSTAEDVSRFYSTPKKGAEDSDRRSTENEEPKNKFTVREKFKERNLREEPSKNKISTPSLEDILSGKARPATIAAEPEPQITSSQPVQSAPKNSNMPPSLEDIKKGFVNQVDSKGVKNIEYSQDDQEITKKRDILFKFKILRRTYKEATIPEYNEYSELKTLEREYDSVVRQLSLDATVANYTKYLTIGFFVFEFILSSVFKIEDIKGFTQQQLLGMNQYEKILFEIGEKNMVTPSSKWSPEMKLVGLIVLNGAVFVGTKMLFRSTGQNIMNMLNQNSGSTTQSAPPQGSARPKMRAPDIDLKTLGSKKTS